MKISLIVPCFNEQDNILPFYRACATAFADTGYEWEAVFVNDGSADRTWEVLRGLYDTQENVKIINFSRNFGKESAMYAGMSKADGDFFSIIDADLQQPPAYVRQMADFLRDHEEYDEVAMFQEKRKESKFICGCKNLFYKIANKCLSVEFKAGASDFRTFRRRVAEALLSMPEYHRFSKGLFSWVGFRIYYMPYTVQERQHGQSSWSFSKLTRYAGRGFISFSTFPLRISTVMGALFALASFIYLIFVGVEHFLFDIQPPGYATIVFLLLLSGGMQMIMLGVIGEYIAQIFIESKQRPLYVIRDFCARTESYRTELPGAESPQAISLDADPSRATGEGHEEAKP